MKEEHLVSIVIRTKNEGKYLDLVLSALEKQTYNNFEIIIVDSGSTDDTLEIARKHKARIYEIPESDFTYSYALNYGISKARGEYIAIISGHSLPLSDTWLADGLRGFEDERVAAVTGHVVEVPFGYYSKTLGKLCYRLFISKKKELFWPFMTNTNSIIKKSKWKKYKFDEEIKGAGEDYDWALEMLSRGYKIVKEPKFSVHHSHLLLGRAPWLVRWMAWQKPLRKIKKRKRPQVASKY